MFYKLLSSRLGVPVATPGVCACSAELDPLGDHALSCNRGVGRGARHKTRNEKVRSALNEAGHVCVLEPPGLTRTDGKRPDSVTVMPFERGLPMAWDVTVHTSPRTIYRCLHKKPEPLQQPPRSGRRPNTHRLGTAQLFAR